MLFAPGTLILTWWPWYQYIYLT